jgi:O-antigen/teichoic acid export membrane protein
MGGLGLIISLGLLAGAAFIVAILLGEQYDASVAVLRILALLPFLSALSNVFGVQIMLVFRLDRAFLRILFLAGFMNVLLAILFVPVWQANGMAAAVLLSEFFVTTTMLLYINAKGLFPLQVQGSNLQWLIKL